MTESSARPTIRIVVSRHSTFYSPLIATIAAGFLEQEGCTATYEVLQPGQRSHALLRDGVADVIQSAVSTNWSLIDKGETGLPVHFAQINRRDGFFLVGRDSDPSFDWKKLEGKTLLADHGLQPLVMLRYAAHRQGVEWSRISVVDAGAPEEIVAAFRAGRGDYVHLQGPAPQQLELDGAGAIVAAVGEAMPPVAFSSLMARPEFLQTEDARAFLKAYRKAREWVDQSPAREVARAEMSFFPGFDFDAVAASVARYQELGCWDGDLPIPPDLYEQSLNVFLHGGAISRRYPCEEVVISPCID